MQLPPPTHKYFSVSFCPAPPPRLPPYRVSVQIVVPSRDVSCFGNRPYFLFFFWAIGPILTDRPTDRPAEQPFVRDYMVKNHSQRFESVFGQRRAKSMMEATAGSIIGVGEVGDIFAARAACIDLKRIGYKNVI